MIDKRHAWVVMLVTLFAGIVAAINAFKVPPMMQALMSELRVDMVTGGWLQSISAVAGLVLAIPAAFLLSRLGPKITGLFALACTVIGATVGALATSAAMLLVGRVIEGIGMSLIAILAPAVISMWFEPQDRGLPMGLWAAWAPIGNVLIFNLAHPLQAAFGWRAVWWFGALLAVVAAVIFGLVVTWPPGMAQREAVRPGAFGRTLLNPTSWLLALTFGAFSFSLLGYATWAPTYLTDTMDVDAARASLNASLMFLAGIPANILAGWLLGRLKNRYALLPLAFVLTSILFFWSFLLGELSVVVFFMVVLGFVSNFIPTAAFTFAPETVPSVELAGLGVAIVMMGSNLGGLAGPPAVGAIVSTAGWTTGSTCLVIVAGLGTIASWFVARRLSRA